MLLSYTFVVKRIAKILLFNSKKELILKYHCITKYLLT